MNYRHLLSVVLLLSSMMPVVAQESMTLSLEDCRAMALDNNKQLMISRERLNSAKYARKEAFAAYLPALDFTGGYAYNQNNISIFDSDQLLPTKGFNPQTGTYEFNLVTNPQTGMPVTTPDGQYIPSTVALIPKESMTFDMHNVFFGAVTLTQPIYMGGKIVALNRMANAAEQLYGTLDESERQNVIYAVDAAYWQVVSVKAKHQLALSYVNLLDSLSHDVGRLVEEGFATKADKLSVDVKLNSAQVDLVKVENGLKLSKMALAQVCGMDLTQQFTLADEGESPYNRESLLRGEIAQNYDMGEVFSRRADLRALGLAIDVAKEKKNVARSTMLPQLALVGAYSFSNPNLKDGFKKEFGGGFSVGAMLTIPLWHWGGNMAKYRQAQSQQVIAQLELQDAQDKVTLQVSQASLKTREAYKTYQMTCANLASADENLRAATLAYREGVATTDNVLEAQTAWLKAHSEQVDAMIEVRLCDTYLRKALGTLTSDMNY